MVLLAAGPDADAAFGGAFERTAIGGENKVSFEHGVGVAWLGWGVAKILHRIVDAHRVHQLAGIHAVVRIPESLELAEGSDQLGAEHLG